MKKLLAITPHLSTGGAPQVLVKRIELIKDNYEIYVIEYSNISHSFIIQKNRIKNLIPSENFFTLGDNKNAILDIINNIKPDIIHMEEIPEMFMDYNIAKEIYKKDRKYKIFETTHSSDYVVDNKLFFPDKFIFVSQYNCFKFNKFGIPTEVVEYPVDKKMRSSVDKNNALKKLGLDPNYKHILNVGLFTPRKNQKYAFEIAKELENEKIKFHFVGNQAGNFEHYWKPLMENKPNNCVIWGERSDVDDFYTACDLFLFTSRGFRYDKELNPLVIKEALQEDIPLFLFPLDVYCGKYDDDPDCTYMIGDLSDDSKLVKEFLFKNDSITNHIQNSIIPKIEKNLEIKDIPKVDKIDESLNIRVVQINNYNESLKNVLINNKIGYVKSDIIDYNDIPPKSNCIRPDDIDRLGVYGLGSKEYSNYLTYRKIIEKEFSLFDFLIIINEQYIHISDNNIISDIKQIIKEMSDNNIKYKIVGYLLFINKTFKNTLFSKYRTDGWDETTKWLEYISNDKDKKIHKDTKIHKDNNLINIDYNIEENKLIFNLINSTPKTVKYNIKLKDNKSEFYSTVVNISNEFNTWVNVDHFKDLKYVNVDFFRNNKLSFTKKFKFPKESKNLYILSTYINSGIKKKTTIDCINSLKGKDILISSHIPIDNDIQKMVKYCVYDDHNPMIKHSLYTKFWNETDKYRIDVNLNELSNADKLNQSLAVLNNIENSIRLAKSLGYDKIVNVTYDFIFSNKDLSTINNLIKDIDKQDKEGFFMKFNDNGLDVLKSVFFIIDVDLWLKIFDNPRTSEIYNKECTNLNIDNFLERYFYKKLENYKDKLIIRESDENKLFNGNINLFSGVEYLTLVPVENKDDEIVLWLNTSNKIDNRKMVVKKYNNNIIEDIINVEITKETIFYKKIVLGNNDNIELKITFIDNETNEIIDTDYFDINKSNIKLLSDNGKFLYKNENN